MFEGAACRRMKSQAELQLMRRSASIAAEGICEAMGSSTPGVSEHQLAARFGAQQLSNRSLTLL